jgi:hypothetical protein
MRAIRKRFIFKCPISSSQGISMLLWGLSHTWIMARELIADLVFVP